MTQSLCHVTVLGPGRRTDLAVPAAAPLTMLLPELVRRCAGAADNTSASAWVLARVGGEPLPPDQSLAASGVLDGEVLCLAHPATMSPSTARREFQVETTPPPPQGPSRSMVAASLGGSLIAASALIASAMIAIGATLTGLRLAGAAALLGVTWVVVAEYVLPRLAESQGARRLPSPLLIAGGAVVALASVILTASGQPFGRGLVPPLIAAYGIHGWRLLRSTPLPRSCSAVAVIADIALIPLLLGVLGVYSLAIGG